MGGANIFLLSLHERIVFTSQPTPMALRERCCLNISERERERDSIGGLFDSFSGNSCIIPYINMITWMEQVHGFEKASEFQTDHGYGQTTWAIIDGKVS